MKKNILYILSSYNRFSGTPKKTLDLIEHSEHNSFLYVYSNAYHEEFKENFVKVCSKVFEGHFGRNIFKHAKNIINIIDETETEIIQTQFFFGELLIGLVKLFRPKVKVIITFEGSMSDGFLKRTIQKIIYKKIHSFIYISNYVKTEKEKVFSHLKKANTAVFFNGTSKLKVDNGETKMQENAFNLLSVSSLIPIKNIAILIDMMQLLCANHHKDIHLFIAGNGSQKKQLKQQVKDHKIEEFVHFLGRQKKIGNLLEKSDILVHPCYIEGFGLSVVEAMIAEKPVVVSNAGALPEIVIHNKSGLLVDPFNAEEWGNAILELKKNKGLANKLAKNARERAEKEFSVKSFVENYNSLYQNI
jgi:glycosyltransferase involved in cell wall biosynthesis